VQRAEIEKFAKAKGIEIIKWFIDKGESGAKIFKERPAAQELINYISNNEIDAIIVFAIDRIGRTMLDTVKTILGFEEKGIAVISVKEQWLQTLDPNIRKLILSILSWVAEFERRRMRERQLAAWAAGKQKGRPPKVDESTYEYYIRRYAKMGLSLRAIWKIMRSSGHDISYETFRRHVYKLGYKKVIEK
jgi:DNA invertase Pin-like site-specific DNA recombinase